MVVNVAVTSDYNTLFYPTTCGPESTFIILLTACNDVEGSGRARSTCDCRGE